MAIRLQREMASVHSSGHATSCSYRPFALPPLSDYLATSTCLDKPGHSLDENIDRLKECLKRAVAAKWQAALIHFNRLLLVST